MKLSSTDIDTFLDKEFPVDRTAEIDSTFPPIPPVEDSGDDDDGCDDCVCYQRGQEDGLRVGWEDAYFFLNPTATDSDFHFAFAKFLRSIEEEDNS
jgi:hypothetical protein